MGVGVVVGVLGLRPATLPVAWAALVGVALGFINARVHRLPDRLIAVGLAGVLGLFALAVVDGAPLHRLLTAILCGLSSAAIFFIVVLVAPRHGMGFGDAQASVLVGTVTGRFGVRTAVCGVLLGMLLAGSFAAALVVMRRANLRMTIAYGPFMLIGALATIAWLG